MKGKANRIHHNKRIKTKRQKYHWGRKLTIEEAGKALQCPKPCSCRGCGNPRKHEGELTRQERRAEEMYK